MRQYEADRRELIAIGYSPNDVEHALAERRPSADSDFELWPENIETVGIFRALETQWRLVAGFGGIAHQGLRYAEARAEIRERRIKDRAGMFADLRLMERAALPILNAKEDVRPE